MVNGGSFGSVGPTAPGRMNCGFSKEELEDMIELYEISDVPWLHPCRILPLAASLQNPAGAFLVHLHAT